MLDKSQFENKAIRPEAGDKAAGFLVGPATVACDKCRIRTHWFSGRIPPLCTCGGKQVYVKPLNED